MRFWAFSAFQPWVTTWLKSFWPETTLRVPSSIFGLSTSMAPSKKTWALASSGEPAKSSMLYGPFGFLLGHAVEQGLALELADLEVVVGDVVVDGGGVLDEAVVGDDRGAGVLGGLELGAQLRAVDGADDDDLGALGDHGRDLVLLLATRHRWRTARRP